MWPPLAGQSLKHHLCIGPNLHDQRRRDRSGVRGQGHDTPRAWRSQRNMPLRCAREEIVGIPAPWVSCTRSLHFVCPGTMRMRGVLQVSQGVLSVTPCPRSCFKQDEPLGHTSQGSLDRLFLAAALPAWCYTLCLSLTLAPRSLGKGGLEGRQAQFHLDPATLGGFSEPGIGPPSWLLFSPVEVGGEVSPGPQSFFLPWNSSIGIS